MKKRLFALVLTLAISLSLGGPAQAAGGFSDVDQNAWYLKYLDTAVSSGLINGRGDGRFSPNDDITGAEGVKLAACIGQLLTEGAVTLTNGSPWYANYMAYAVEQGLIDTRLDQYSLNSPITRAQLMDMLCRAIPQDQRVVINAIPDGAIPDLSPSADYRDNVYTLYRMGIVTGADKQGSCQPEKRISRAEVAALVARIVDDDLRVSFRLEKPQSDPLNFRDEAALTAALEGEWSYCPPASDTPAAWLFFGRDGGFSIRIIDTVNNAIWEYIGFWRLDHWYSAETEAPDMLCLTILDSEDNDPSTGVEVGAGDYLIQRKTLCDGEIVFELMQLNNGDSLLSTHFDDWSPILKKYTDWQPTGALRKGENFCGAVWKVDYGTKTIWLDDAAEDGDNINRYEALPYPAAPQLDLTDQPDWLLGKGTTWIVWTDEMGRVKEMQPCIHDGPEPLSEEEAAELLSEVDEVQGYVAQGMVAFFDNETETIDGEPCVVIALGTDHEEYFVRELFYAVSPSGGVYTYNPFTDSWDLLCNLNYGY